MTGLIVIFVVIVALAAGALWAWRASANRFPSDETLRHPRPFAAEPLIRPESQHFDSPAASDIDQHGGREHKR